MNLFASILNPEHLIQSGGLLLVAAIVFAESGLLIGFFLPGDSLLFSAGFFAAQGQLPIAGLLVVICAAAISGDAVGYYIGKKTGKRVFKKKDGIIFRHEYLERAKIFYDKHGGKTVMLARFIPVVRTFAPVVAGATDMPFGRFAMFNIVGGVTWGASVTLCGYWLGSKIPNIDHYVAPVIIAVMVLSFAPSLYHIVGDPKTCERIVARFKRKA